MKVATELIGYKLRPWPNLVHGLLSSFTDGINCLFGSACPRAVLVTLQSCPLSQAQYVLAKIQDSDPQVVKVHNASATSVLPQTDSRLYKDGVMKSFVLLQSTFVYDWTTATFMSLPRMPDDLPAQVSSCRKALLLIHQGAEWLTLNPASAWNRRERSRLYQYDAAAGKPSLMAMSYALLAHPLHLIQYLELAFHLYEAYYWYAGLLLSITLLFCVAAAGTLYKARLQLFNSVVNHHPVPIVQAGVVRLISSQRLVPGDVLVVLKGRATCDMVLLQGNCLVEESALSGEAAQLRKTSFVSSAEAPGLQHANYDPDKEQYCTVYAGTYVQQMWNEQDVQDEVLAMVVRTGSNTAVGSMLLQVMTPYKRLGLRDPFNMDLLKYCSFAAVLQLAIFLPSMIRSGRHAHTAWATIQHLIRVLIAATPPSIPTVLIFSLFRCGLVLRQQQILVHYSAKIKTAAAVEVVVFDKTGTLTGSIPQLHGMVPVISGKFEELQRGAVQWPNSLKQCAAVCNSLNLVNKSSLVGDAADFTAFKACEATFLGRNTVSLPGKVTLHRSPSMTILTILKRFEFAPQLLRSGAVVCSSFDPPDQMLFFVRGAPASIEQMVRHGSLPQDYRQVVDRLSGQSLRLLALAVGVMRGLDKSAVSLMTQEQLEAHAESFDLLGLLVLSNDVQPETKDTIMELQSTGLRTLMATGDYHHTALAVARGVGMVAPQGQVIIIQHKSETRPAGYNGKSSALRLSSPQHNDSSALSYNRLQREKAQATHAVSFADQLTTSSNSEHQGLLFHLDNSDAVQDDALQALRAIAQGEAQCCVTGAAVQHLLQLGDQPLLETVMRNAVVFSRMKSHQKGQIMDLLGCKGLQHVVDGQQYSIAGLGKTCMYCGDGVNDLIALAHADVGVAVGTGDAATGAAISIRKSSIAGLLPMLRETRAATCLKLAAVRFMVLYQVLLSLMYCTEGFFDSSGASIAQRSVIDVVALILGALCSLQPARDHLTARLPPQHFCVPQNFITLSANTLLAASLCAVSAWYLSVQPWFRKGTEAGYKDPVVTWTWTVALFQVVAIPHGNVALDTQEFSKIWTPIVSALLAAFIADAVVCGLLGVAALDKLDLLKFYAFPWAFRWRSYLLVSGSSIATGLLLRALRNLLDWSQQARQRQHQLRPSFRPS